MAVTKWHGGATGLEEMPDDVASIYYTEITKEVPRLYYPGHETYPYGYFVGETSDYSTHYTLYPYIANSLKVWVNGVQLPLVYGASEGGVYQSNHATGSFQIKEDITGWVKATYHPYDENYEAYFRKSNKYQIKTNVVARLCPIMKLHVEEILTALDSLSIRTEAIKRRFSIDEYTGFPTNHEVTNIVVNEGEGTYDVTGTKIMENHTPFMIQLVQEISDHILFLYEHSISKYSAAVVTRTPEVHTENKMIAEYIESFREDINALEHALDNIGV